MKLASDDETLAENKVLILYALNKANKPLTNDVLYKIVLAAANMNYFYFQQFMLDLIEVGYICSFQKEDQTLYQVTENGKRTLDLTLDLLPGIIKLKADTNLKPIIDSSEEEYSEAKRLCEILQYFKEIPKELIPTNSLLREFLGNGDFKY